MARCTTCRGRGWVPGHMDCHACGGSGIVKLSPAKREKIIELIVRKVFRDANRHDSIASLLGVEPGQVKAVAAHLTMGSRMYRPIRERIERRLAAEQRGQAMPDWIRRITQPQAPGSKAWWAQPTKRGRKPAVVRPDRKFRLD